MPASTSPAVHSYRCRTRAYDHACADDSAPDTHITVKAPNAGEAMRLAHLVTGAAIVDTERQDGTPCGTSLKASILTGIAWATRPFNNTPELRAMAFVAGLCSELSATDAALAKVIFDLVKNEVSA